MQKIVDKIKNKIIKNPIELIMALTVISIIFICIGHKYRDNIQKKLQTKLFVLPSSTVDYWSLAHFVWYFAFGFIYPNYPLNFTMLGIIWEVVEDYLASDSNKQLVNCTSDKINFWCNGIQDGYWYGKWDDVIFNTFGYLVGQALRNRSNF